MDGRLHDLLRRQTQRADAAAGRAIRRGAESLKPNSLLKRARKRTSAEVARTFREEADESYAALKRELDRIADAEADATAKRIEELTGRPAKAARGSVDGRQLRADLRRSNARRAKNADKALVRPLQESAPGTRGKEASDAAKDAWKAVSRSRARKRFVDSRGRAWKDGAYNEMRAKTMEANAKRAAQLATLRANGFKLARITDGVQENTCEDCHLWRGAIVSLTGRTYRGYPALEKVVATTKLFHPNCIHYLEPYEEDGSRRNTKNAMPDEIMTFSERLSLLLSGSRRIQHRANEALSESSEVSRDSGILKCARAFGALRKVESALARKVSGDDPLLKSVRSEIARLRSEIDALGDALHSLNARHIAARDDAWNADKRRARIKKDAILLLPDDIQFLGRAFDAMPTEALIRIRDTTRSISEIPDIDKDENGDEVDNVSYEQDCHVYLTSSDIGARGQSALLHETGHASMSAMRDMDLLSFDDDHMPPGSRRIIDSLEDDVRNAMASIFGRDWSSARGAGAANALSERIFGMEASDLPQVYKHEIGVFCDLLQNATRGEYGCGHRERYYSSEYLRLQEIVAEASEMALRPETDDGCIVMKHLGRTLSMAFKFNFGVQIPD